MNADVRAAYRRFYRISLKAVQYSVPARYSIITKVNRLFRQGPYLHGAEEQEIQDNTFLFLEIAAKEKGIEHKIVRNLCFVEWSQWQQSRSGHKPVKNLVERELRSHIYDDYKAAVQELNQVHRIRVT